MNRMKAFMVVAAATVAFTAVVSTFDTADAARRCKSGYVWRDAADGDGACVTPEERDVAKAQNQNAENNRQKGGGAYGPKTCRQGYVWREAFAGDTSCVTPYERAQAKAQNAGARITRSVAGGVISDYKPRAGRCFHCPCSLLAFSSLADPTEAAALQKAVASVFARCGVSAYQVN
jgi:hypothetical protein